MVQLYARTDEDFLVNTTVTGNQGSGVLTALPDGGFVAAWTDSSLLGGDSDASSIKAQLFDAAGHKLGAEFLVNSTTAGIQNGVTVTTLGAGRFVILWTDRSGLGGDASLGAIKAQLFAGDGGRIGQEFLVNTTTSGNQVAPVATGTSGGGFVVAWSDASQQGADTSSWSVRAQLFDANAGRIGGEFLANSETYNAQNSAAIAPLPGGGFVIAWTDLSGTGGDPSGYAIRAQRFDASGAKIGPEQLVNSYTPGDQVSPTIVSQSDGSYLIAWNDLGYAGEPRASDPIRAQMFDSQGAKLGAEFLLDSVAYDLQPRLQSAALPDGGFILAWTKVAVGGDRDVVAQVFDGSGARVGAEFVVNAATAGDQTLTGLTVLGSGDVLVSWNEGPGIGSDGSAGAVKAQLLHVTMAAPTDIALSTTSVSETAVDNLPVAILGASGALNSAFSYQLLSDSTGGAFGIDGDRLIVLDNRKLDFETMPAAQIRIRSTDLNGQSYEESISLAIGDAAVESRYSAADAFVTPSRPGETEGASAVTALAGGRSLLLWHSFGPLPPRIQLFDANGKADGSPIDLQIGSSAGFNQSVVALPTGGFAIVFEALDSSFNRVIKAGFYDAAGHSLGAAVTVNSSYFVDAPQAVALANGTIAIAWLGGPSGSSYQDFNLLGQILSPSGARLGGQFQINTDEAGSQGNIQLAPLANGGFLASWGEESGVRGQLFNAGGQKIGGELTLHSDPDAYFRTEIASLADGSLALLVIDFVAEVEGVDIARLSVQRFDSAGQKLAGEVVVTEAAPNLQGKIAALPDGGFVVAFENVLGQLQAQLFTGSGEAVGTPFIVNPDPGTEAADVALSVGAHGEILFSWTQVLFDEGGGFVTSHVGERRLSLVDGRQDGGSGNDALAGTTGRDALYGFDGDDRLSLQQGGSDQAYGGAGNDGIIFGARLDSSDVVDGGDGTNTLVVQGNYGNLVLAGMSHVEVLLVASGSDSRFGDTSGGNYAYRVASVDPNIAAGGMLIVNATGLKPTESLAFDGSAETDGNFRIFAGMGVDDLRGGAGNDGFFFGADHNLTAADKIAGGGGTDSIALRGDYAVAFGPASFTGIEVLTFLSGHSNEYGGPIATGGFDYDVTIADGNLASGGLLQVIGVNLRADESLRFDGRPESDGAFRILSGAGDDILFGGSGNDTLYGALGADDMDGGAGADTYLFRTAQDSTASARDTIAFGAGDRIDLSLIDAIDGTPVNDDFGFIGSNAFSHTAGELRAFQAGGQWLVEGDVNGDGTADFVLALTNAAPITANDFIL